MGRFFEIGTIITNVGLVAWLLWWTWIGSRNPLIAVAGTHGPSGARWYRFRWIAAGLLVVTGVVLGLSDPVRRNTALSYLGTVLVIAHVTIGYSGWVAARVFSDWRAKRRGA